MPDVHVPRIGDDDETTAASKAAETGAEAVTARSPTSWHPKGLVRIVLELVLISTGVFLGLLGEQWRESARDHDRADASLRNFGNEIAANRESVLQVVDYHAQLRKSLESYLESDEPKTMRTLTTNTSFKGVRLITFEHTAWDLAVATGSLAHIDSGLAYAISKAYTSQDALQSEGRALTQASLGGASFSDQNFGGTITALLAYLGDANEAEPRLIAMYDDLLKKLGAPRTRGPGESAPAR